MRNNISLTDVKGRSYKIVEPTPSYQPYFSKEKHFQNSSDIKKPQNTESSFSSILEEKMQKEKILQKKRSII